MVGGMDQIGRAGTADSEAWTGSPAVSNLSRRRWSPRAVTNIVPVDRITPLPSKAITGPRVGRHRTKQKGPGKLHVSDRDVCAMYGGCLLGEV
jgi:hypothetical protein